MIILDDILAELEGDAYQNYLDQIDKPIQEFMNRMKQKYGNTDDSKWTPKELKEFKQLKETQKNLDQFTQYVIASKKKSVVETDKPMTRVDLIDYKLERNPEYNKLIEEKKTN